jgi:cell division protein ZapA
MDKSIITVNIFGNEYTIKGVAEPDYIMTLANYLNNKMAEVQESTGLKDVKKIAILAAINISDELFEVKKSIKESYVPNDQLQAIRNKIENLIALTDKELPDAQSALEDTGVNQDQKKPPAAPEPGPDKGQDLI